MPFTPLVNGITSGPGILISPIHITSLLVPFSLYNTIPYLYTSPRLRDFIQLLVTASLCVGLAVGNPLYVRISFAFLTVLVLAETYSDVTTGLPFVNLKY